jgi:hypothetical protein
VPHRYDRNRPTTDELQLSTTKVQMLTKETENCNLREEQNSRYRDPILVVLLDNTEGEADDGLGLCCEELAEAAVVGNEGGNNTNSTTCLSGVSRVGEFSSGEDEEGDGKQAEEDDEADVLAKSTNEEEESDQTPCDEIDSKCAGELAGGRTAIGCQDSAGRDQDGRVGHPESTIRSECGSTKDVTAGELPHTRQQLGETTAEDGHADNGVGVVDAPGLEVEQRQDESRRREREEAERAGVSDSCWGEGYGGSLVPIPVAGWGRGANATFLEVVGRGVCGHVW